MFLKIKLSSDDIMVSNIRHIEALRRASTSSNQLFDFSRSSFGLVEVDLNICIDELEILQEKLRQKTY